MEQRCSLTVVTILSQPLIDRQLHSPLLYTYRENSNTASDFASLLNGLFDGGYLDPDTYLIMDNATVHNDNLDTEQAFNKLESHGVKIRRLPTYSPELNPCELVFAFVKNTLRSSPKRVEVDGRMVDVEFRTRLEEALSLVTHEQVEKYYEKCKRAESYRK